MRKRSIILSFFIVLMLCVGAIAAAAVMRNQHSSGGDSREVDDASSKHESVRPLEKAGKSAEPDAGSETEGDVSPQPFIVIRAHDKRRYSLRPTSDEGGFEEDDLRKAREAWTHRTGTAQDVHPRLLDIIYKTMRHFKRDEVIITSGVRPGRKSSMHAWGRAADFSIPGVGFRELAKHLRTYGFVGVGFYPRTRGVHIDVRQSSFFWVSWEPRGKRWREKCILADHAKAMDERARENGISPPDPLPAAGHLAREKRSWRRRQLDKRRRAARARQAANRRRVKRASKAKRPMKRSKARPAVRARRSVKRPASQ